MSATPTPEVDPTGPDVVRAWRGPGAQGAVILELAAGQLFLRTGETDVSDDELEVATAILGHVRGPGSVAHVALVSEVGGGAHLAAVLARTLGRIRADHPHLAWGVLLTAASGEPAVQQVRAQVRDMHGDVIVCYDTNGGDLQSADRVQQVCHDYGAGFVLITTATQWELMVQSQAHELLPDGALVVRMPHLVGAGLVGALNEHATQLHDFHGVAVPEHVVLAAAHDLAAGMDDPRLAPLPGRDLDPVSLGRARLNHWVARQLVSPTASVPVVAEQLAVQLRQVVVGQDHAVTALAGHVAVGCAGLRLRSDRPRTQVLLTGPTGTGKTLLAASLASALGVPLIRVDLAAYSNEHRVATLLGSPPGYVGSTDDRLWLTSRIADAPTAVLLLDEFDKCSPAVWGPLLIEMLGAGTLTDERGRTVSCRSLHVVATANIGGRDMTRARVGFGVSSTHDAAAGAVAAVRRLLPDELFNRFDDVLVLQPIGAAAAGRILDAALGVLARRLAPLGYRVAVSAGARAALLDQAIDPSDGARRVHRTLERAVLAPTLLLAPGNYQAVRAGAGVRVRAARRRQVAEGELGTDVVVHGHAGQLDTLPSARAEEQAH